MLHCCRCRHDDFSIARCFEPVRDIEQAHSGAELVFAQISAEPQCADEVGELSGELRNRATTPGRLVFNRDSRGGNSWPLSRSQQLEESSRSATRASS
jgi:hypothetical protein